MGVNAEVKDVLEVGTIDMRRAGVALRKARTLQEVVANIKISTDECLQQATDIMNKAIKARIKELNAERLSMTRPLDEVKAKIMAKYRPAIEALESAEKLVKFKILEYTKKKEAEIAEKEAKLRAQAEAEAEKERAKLEAKAEKARQKGKENMADELLMAAESIVPMAPILDRPKANGVSVRKIWRARVTDKAALPENFKIPDMEALNKIAASTHGEMQVPGVEFYSEDIVVGGRG